MLEPIALEVPFARVPRPRSSLAPRLRATALVALALLVPAVGRADVSEKRLEAPASLRIVAASPTTLVLSWRAVRDARGYELARDGVKVGSTTTTHFTFTGLSCRVAYTLEVVALVDAGHRSAPASVIASPSACDTVAPVRAAAASAGPEADSVLPVEEQAPLETSTDNRPRSQPTLAGVPGVVPAVGVPWAGAGAFVWHETDVAPEALGAELRASGFSWVAILLHDGLEADPVEGDWIRRFREASRLSVGGWGVLRDDPEREAALAHDLLDAYSLDFYIANAEAEYKFSGDRGQSEERYRRSGRFVETFRQLAPDTPAAVSSYCRADMQDIDWDAWEGAGFAFLPQAYVNDFGSAASPAACVEGATEFFPDSAVHPTVGVYAGQGEEPSTERYAALLDEAGTVGFSVYLAETRMRADEWRVFGAAIDELAIAHPTGSSPGRQEPSTALELGSAE